MDISRQSNNNFYSIQKRAKNHRLMLPLGNLFQTHSLSHQYDTSESTKGSSQTHVHIPASPFRSCVILGGATNLSETWFFQLYNDGNDPKFAGLL